MRLTFCYISYGKMADAECKRIGLMETSMRLGSYFRRATSPNKQTKHGLLQMSSIRVFSNFLKQIAAIAIIFITENILFTMLNVFGHFHQALF